MELKKENLNNLEEFPFPFKPYNIQKDFMSTLYAVLKDGKLGIFESPTGTGKSLSIVCGALKWLKDHKQQIKQDLIDKITLLENEKQIYESEVSDWFFAQSKGIKITQKLNELKIEEKKVLEYENKIEKIKNQKKKIRLNEFKKLCKPTIPSSGENLNPEDTSKIEDEELLLDEVINNEKEHSDDEENEESNTSYHPTQIIIASRTHSQLTQLVSEIKKSPFRENVCVISLASRQNYCINPSVRKLNNVTLINEKCLDLQKKEEFQVKTDSKGKVIKKKKTSKCMCPYYKQSNIEDLRGFALSHIHDIEDLVQVGKEINACPYYTSRKAAEDAEIILVPYNTILHKSTREASGIRLKDNVIVIDEAHNILESLAQMHSSELSQPQLYYSLQVLKCYKNRYNTMFSAITLRGLNQLIFIVNKLLALFEEDFKEEVTEILSLQSFMLSTEIDQYNFFNIINFCKSSKLAQKVRSYSIKYPLFEETGKETPKNGVKDFLSTIGAKEPAAKLLKTSKLPIPNNSTLAVISFLECLTYSYEDGRILLTKNPEKQSCKLQFLLLNPVCNFSDIINEARSVVVAGGTMKPYEEFRERLFMRAGACEDRILQFSCDHIIPQENILPIAMIKGLKSEKLSFNFTNRCSMRASLIAILLRTCKLVKGGIVVFFPSYNYENWIYEEVRKIDFGRIIFREPQKSGAVDEVLEKYAATIKKSRDGAIMFSVVGGKLSEGLNFTDDLGRCVIVVGLPYANITAADLKEKMLFLDKKEGQGTGQQFYENLCMKAVNQCIGRSVRHRNDYSTVLLLDERFSRSNIQNALPDWIKQSLKVAEGEEAISLIAEFFKKKNNK